MAYMMKAKDIVFAYVKDHHLEDKFILNMFVFLNQVFVVILFRWLFYGYNRYFFPFRFAVLIIFWTLLCVLEVLRHSEPLLKKYGVYQQIEGIAGNVLSGSSGGRPSSGSQIEDKLEAQKDHSPMKPLPRFGSTHKLGLPPNHRPPKAGPKGEL